MQDGNRKPSGVQTTPTLVPDAGVAPGSLATPAGRSQQADRASATSWQVHWLSTHHHDLNPLKKQRRWQTVDGVGRRHTGGHVAGATDKEGVEEIAGYGRRPRVQAVCM